MPRFVIERNFTERLDLDRGTAEEIRRVNDECGVKWVISFLSVDKKKTYCIYEAPNAEAVSEAARRLDIPVDAVMEIGDELVPEVLFSKA